LLGLLLLCQSAALGADPRYANLSPDDSISKSGQVIPYSRLDPDDLGPIRVEYDMTGIRGVSPVPRPGVHPRILISPSDREPLQQLYQTTPHGRRMWAMLVAWCDILKGKITSLDQCPKYENGSYAAAYHRSGFARTAEQYQRILAGDPEGQSELLTQGWTKVAETPNHFAFHPRHDLPWMARPWYQRAHWLVPGEAMRTLKRPWNPVQKAFRTAGIVRGRHPYAIVVDDIQKDDEPHHYKWLLQLSDDLTIERYLFDEKSEVGSLMLRSLDPQDDRRLLVAVLECHTASPPHDGVLGRIEQYMANMRWGRPGKRLALSSWSVAPEYKILLLPLRNKAEIPEMVWNKDHTQVTLRWADQADVVRFRQSTRGYTLFEIVRNGTRIVDTEADAAIAGSADPQAARAD